MTRPWRTRAGVAVLLVGVSAALAAGPAAATPAGATAATAAAVPAATGSSGLVVEPQVLTSAGKLDITLIVRDGQNGTTEAIDPDSVRVQATPEGKPAETLTSTQTNSGRQKQGQEVMLLLDVSGSMVQNHYFEAAKAAAKQFLKRVPATLPVGLVTFGDPALEVQRPTTDHNLVAGEIDVLPTGGNTAMYQAVTLGVAAMGDTPLRSLVMLTDGTNDDKTGSKTIWQQANKALQKSSGQAQVRFAGILIGDQPADDINRIAGASRVFRDSGGDLTSQLQKLNAYFQDAGDTFKKQTNVTAVVPNALADQTVSMTITATVGGRPVTTGAFAQPLAGAAASTAPDTSTTANAPSISTGSRLAAISTPIALVALVALFGGLAMLLFLSSGALVGDGDEDSEVLRRLQIYSVSGSRPQPVVITEQTTRLGDNAFTRGAVGLVDRLTARVQLERTLDSRLEAAGLPLRTAEWTLLHIGSGVGLSLLFLIVTRGRLFGLLIGLIVGLALPWVVLTMLKTRRETRFMRQLPDTLQLLAGSIAAGYSLPQAMDSVVRESEPPISSEFNRALVEARLGMLAEDALEGIAGRTGSQDFSWIVMAIRIQREVGGNLAQLLNSIADTMRERERLRRQVQALSAEGRLSGFILGALPIVFALYLVLVRPDYISPLFTTPLGLLLLIMGSVLLVVGGFWMSRVIKVEV